MHTGRLISEINIVYNDISDNFSFDYKAVQSDYKAVFYLGENIKKILCFSHFLCHFCINNIKKWEKPRLFFIFSPKIENSFTIELYSFIVRIKVVRNVILNNIDFHDQPSKMHSFPPRNRQNFPDSWNPKIWQMWHIYFRLDFRYSRKKVFPFFPISWGFRAVCM